MKSPCFVITSSEVQPQGPNKTTTGKARLRSAELAREIHVGVEEIQPSRANIVILSITGVMIAIIGVIGRASISDFGNSWLNRIDKSQATQP